MVEPVILNNEQLRAAISDVPLFALVPKSPGYSPMICLAQKNKSYPGAIAYLFYIVDFNDGKDFYCGLGRSSSEFMDFLIENYPDHAEWFLFHPEWLS
jgi:hypothetical protein